MSLAAIDVGPRQDRARAALAGAGLDGLVVTSPTNIRWLTGFAGSNATVVISDVEIVLFTDNRYRDRAPDELARAGSDAEVVVATADLGDRVAATVAGVERVGLEADHITWARQRTIAEDWLTGHELVATEGLIDRLRAAKDPAEIARIQAAAASVDKALAGVVGRLRERLTELAFAAELEAAIRSGDADDIGFDTIVASGPNGAIPHHSPGERVIAAGDLVIVDVGGMVEGYRSDMTRTFCVGSLSTDQARHFDTVIAAQQAGVEAMVVGAETGAVDRAARDVIAAAGWADEFTHGTGHGIGLDIHELPRVAAGAVDVYEPGTVATVEPGVYLRGVGGARIEDTCVATGSGGARLTHFPYDPELT